jgi:hypothetical protein
MAKHAGTMTQMSRLDRVNDKQLTEYYGKQYDVYNTRRGTTGFPVFQTVDESEAKRITKMVPGYDYCETNTGWL